MEIAYKLINSADPQSRLAVIITIFTNVAGLSVTKIKNQGNITAGCNCISVGWLSGSLMTTILLN